MKRAKAAKLPAPPAPANLAPRPRRKWRRRLVRVLLVLLVLAVALRVAVPVLAPWGAARVGGLLGLDVRLDDLHLALWDGRARIRGLEVRPKQEGAESLLELDLADAELDLGALLSGELRLNRVHVDGLRVRVVRDEAGHWNVVEALAALLAPAEGATEEPASEEEASDEPARFPLESPVRVDALRAQNVVIELEDHAQDPPFLARAFIEGSLSDLGAPDADLRASFALHAPGVLDLLRADGVVKQGPDALDGRFELALSRLRARNLAPYLALLGFEAQAESISLALSSSLAVARHADDPSAVKVRLGLHPLRVEADAVTALSVDQGHIDVEHLSLAHIDGLSAELDGLTATAALDERGILFAAGIVFGGATPPGAPVASTPPEPEPAAPAPAAVASDAYAPPAFLEALSSLRVARVQLGFRDAFVSPPVELECFLDRGTLVREQDAGGARLARAELHLALRAPGVVETLTLDGVGRLFDPQRRLTLELRGTGLTLDRLRPFLAQIAIEPELVAGTLGASIAASLDSSADGALRGELAIRALHLEDQGVTLAEVREIALTGFELSPAGGLRLREASIAGIDLPLHRDAEGISRTLGLRFDPAVLASAQVAALAEAVLAAPSESDPDAPRGLSFTAPKLPWPRLEIERMACVDTRLRVRDDALAHPLDVEFSKLGAELEGFVLLADPAAAPLPPAALRLWLSAPGLAESVELQGTLSVAPGCASGAAQLALRSTGIAPDLLREYLAEAGLESQLSAGELAFDLTAEFAFEDRDLTAGLGVTGFALREGDNTLVALDALHVRGARAGPAGVSIEAIELDAPKAAIAREADGTLRAAGFRFDDSKRTSVPVPVPEPAASSEPAPAPPALDPLALALAPLAALPFPIALGRAELRAGALEWRDERVVPPVDTVLNAELALRDLALAPDHASFALDGDVRAEEAFRRMRFTARAEVRSERASVEGTLDLEGVHPGELEVYIPAGAGIGMEDGRVRAGFALSLEEHATGGQRARLQLTELAVGDRDGAEPLVALGRAALEVGRIDASAGLVEIEEIALEGLELDATRSADGQRLEVAGFAIPLQGAPPPPAPAADAPAAPGLALSAWSAFAPSQTSLPEVRLGKLDVGIARLTLHDEFRPGSAPIVLSARAHTEAPLLLLGPEPGKLEPLKLTCELAVEPLVAHVALALELRPFAPEPFLGGELRVTGIDAHELLALVPELAARIDASGLRDGRAQADFEVRLSWRKRGPLDFDLRNGFAGEVVVRDVELHEGDDERALAGVDAIFLDLERILPATGDVFVRSLEIDRPHGYARKEAGGVRALGLLVALPAAEPQTTPAPTADASATPPAPVEPAPEPTPEPAATPAPRPPELRIQQLLVSGLDFTLEDATVEPPTKLPLTDLEFDLKRFTTRGLHEHHPFTLRVRLNAGDVELPVRERAAHQLLGLVGGVTSAIGVTDSETKLEPRPAFDEIAFDATLALAPIPDGRFDLRVREFELLTLAAMARQSGITIQDGLMDAQVEGRFDEQGSLHVKSRTTLEHLSVSEPAGGPISSFLVVPYPLDTMLWVLQDDQGRQVIPITYTVEAGSLSRAQIVRKATAAFGVLVGKAIASSPLRIGKGALDFTGITALFGGDEPSELLGQTLELRYAPALTAPPELELEPEAFRSKLAEFADEDELRLELSHVFGTGDLERAAEFANPDPGLVVALGERLRQRKAMLLSERMRLGRLVGALHGIGRVEQAAASRGRVLELDRELANTEQALDDLYSLLAPGAELRGERRTKAAALELARVRLETLRERLIELSGGELAGRIEIRRPRYRIPESETALVTITARSAR